MKRNRIFIAGVVALTVLAGCGKSKVIGTYQSSLDEVFDIKKDGTVQYYDDGDAEDEKCNGTWEVKGNTLYMSIDVDGTVVKFESPIDDNYIAPDVTSDNYGWGVMRFTKR